MGLRDARLRFIEALETGSFEHEFRPRVAGTRWYIKGHFQAGVLILISVHPL